MVIENHPIGIGTSLSKPTLAMYLLYFKNIIDKFDKFMNIGIKVMKPNKQKGLKKNFFEIYNSSILFLRL